MGNQQSRTCCLPFPVGRLRLFTPTAYNLLNHPVQNRLYPHQLHVTLWHANNLSFVPFGWLSVATTLFWSFLKEKNCLQRVPWTVRIWILTLVFNIAYAGASIITLTTCPNSLSPFSTFQRMADGTFLRTCRADWTWRLEMDWHWLRAEFYTQSPNLVFVGLAGALQVRYSFWPSLSWAIGHSAKKLRPFCRKRWILMNPCLPMLSHCCR